MLEASLDLYVNAVAHKRYDKSYKQQTEDLTTKQPLATSNI
jgi:hypothetical protein